MGADTNVELDTITPTTDAEWLEFFARAVGKEIKQVTIADPFIKPFFPKIAQMETATGETRMKLMIR